MAENDDKTIVAVTGASGFIASHLIATLLQHTDRCYVVHGTVRGDTESAEYDYLRAMCNNDSQGQSRLKLFTADLCQPDSVEAYEKAFQNCSAVFHVACPVLSSNTTYENSVTPALDGTLNVMKAAMAVSTIKRMVFTSSICAIVKNYGELPKDHVYSEADYSDEEGMRANGDWYCLGKTLGEMEAVKFVAKDECQFDIVVLCPALTYGPVLRPTVNASVKVVWNYLVGAQKTIKESSRWTIDVRDLAELFILALQTKEASGKRYLAANLTLKDAELCQLIRDSLLESKSPLLDLVPVPDENAPDFKNTPFKTALAELGLPSFRSMQDTIHDTVESFINFGLAVHPSS